MLKVLKVLKVKELLGAVHILRHLGPEGVGVAEKMMKDDGVV